MFGNEEVDGTSISSKWLNFKEDVAYKKTINCTNVAELRNIRKYLYKLDINGRIK
jgi:hypothetical protein